MTRYIIKRTMTEGYYKGLVCYLGKYGYAIDTSRPVSESETYASRKTACNARLAYERQRQYQCARRYEVVPVEFGTMIRRY